MTVWPEGKRIVEQQGSAVNIAIGGENKAITVRCNDLKRVDALLDVWVDMTPSVRDASLPIGVSIDENVVGFTLVVGDGTSLTPTIEVLGD